ncbi:hypothetical protein PAPYR_2037 [Paratrimastix pyriformis]|uniref:Uncharacterized protein n=1 Tax=Paratrimastix pyriformis TaxID=342808 RepID=A0ABQ8USP7_9EUKA|nr:hypothetical protein PAPYR_2037 [Paratrimastix pyriformis]
MELEASPPTTTTPPLMMLPERPFSPPISPPPTVAAPSLFPPGTPTKPLPPPAGTPTKPQPHPETGPAAAATAAHPPHHGPPGRTAPSAAVQFVERMREWHGGRTASRGKLAAEEEQTDPGSTFPLDRLDPRAMATIAAYMQPNLHSIVAWAAICRPTYAASERTPFTVTVTHSLLDRLGPLWAHCLDMGRWEPAPAAARRPRAAAPAPPTAAGVKHPHHLEGVVTAAAPEGATPKKPRIVMDDDDQTPPDAAAKPSAAAAAATTGSPEKKKRVVLLDDDGRPSPVPAAATTTAAGLSPRKPLTVVQDDDDESPAGAGSKKEPQPRPGAAGSPATKRQAAAAPRPAAAGPRKPVLTTALATHAGAKRALAFPSALPGATAGAIPPAVPVAIPTPTKSAGGSHLRPSGPPPPAAARALPTYALAALAARPLEAPAPGLPMPPYQVQLPGWHLPFRWYAVGAAVLGHLTAEWHRIRAAPGMETVAPYAVFPHAAAIRFEGLFLQRLPRLPPLPPPPPPSAPAPAAGAAAQPSPPGPPQPGPVPTRAPSLAVLHLSPTSALLPPGDALLQSFFPAGLRYPALKRLSLARPTFLAGTHVTPALVRAVVAACPALSAIDLSGCGTLGGDILVHLLAHAGRLVELRWRGADPERLWRAVGLHPWGGGVEVKAPLEQLDMAAMTPAVTPEGGQHPPAAGEAPAGGEDDGLAVSGGSEGGLPALTHLKAIRLDRWAGPALGPHLARLLADGATTPALESLSMVGCPAPLRTIARRLVQAHKGPAAPKDVALVAEPPTPKEKEPRPRKTPPPQE